MNHSVLRDKYDGLKTAYNRILSEIIRKEIAETEEALSDFQTRGDKETLSDAGFSREEIEVIYRVRQNERDGETRCQLLHASPKEVQLHYMVSEFKRIVETATFTSSILSMDPSSKVKPELNHVTSEKHGAVKIKVLKARKSDGVP